MFLEAIVLGIIIGLLRGGRFSNLSKIHMKAGALIILLLLLQFSMVFLGRVTFIIPYRVLISYGLSVMIFILVSFSLAKPSFYLIPMGGLLNIIAMSFNGLKMPVRLPQELTPYFLTLKSGILSGEIFNYTLFSTSHEIFRYLGKIIILPEWYYGIHVLTVGDFIIALGVLFYIQSEMNNTSYFRRGNVYGFSGYKKMY